MYAMYWATSVMLFSRCRKEIARVADRTAAFVIHITFLTRTPLSILPAELRIQHHSLDHHPQHIQTLPSTSLCGRRGAIMGRRPNAVVGEFFHRGQKLDDSSNRYQHTCKKCGEHVRRGHPPGRSPLTTL